jgi:hypothetical protein
MNTEPQNEVNISSKTTLLSPARSIIPRVGIIAPLIVVGICSVLNTIKTEYQKPKLLIAVIIVFRVSIAIITDEEIMSKMNNEMLNIATHVSVRSRSMGNNRLAAIIMEKIDVATDRRNSKITLKNRS